MYNALDGTGGDMIWNGSERIGKLGAGVREMKVLSVQMETVTLIGKGR